MIVDMRLRPPLPGWRDTPLFQPGGRSATWHPDFPRPPSVDSRSPELLLAEMDEAGIALGVVMGRQSPGRLGSAPNTELVEWLASHPSRFVAWTGLDVTRPMDEVLAEMRRFSRAPGFVGVSIEPSIAPGFTGADDRRLYPLYDECQRTRTPVSVTLSAILQASERAPVTQGAPAQLYRVALDFPKLDIHVAHGAWPWVMEMIGVAFTCPNVWLSPDQYLVPPLPGASLIAKAAATYFPDRTLFGTAYPFKPLGPMVSAYRAWGWPKAIERRILGENALRLMKLR
jgi:predicted TIM-barrel fold metal-dependent hydrolase